MAFTRAKERSRTVMRPAATSMAEVRGVNLVRHHGGHRCAPVGRWRQDAQRTRRVLRAWVSSPGNVWEFSMT
eukprot:5272289-Prymnesium_polylepis.1